MTDTTRDGSVHTGAARQNNLRNVDVDILVDAGSTVVLVEHDLNAVASADWVIDLGAGGGANGATVEAAGTPAEVAANAHSVTAPYLARRLQLQPSYRGKVGSNGRRPGPLGWASMTMIEALAARRAHGLKKILI